MTYQPGTDYVGLYRAITGGAKKGEMPGLDFVVAALQRSGLLTVSISGSQPTTNQSKTAWFRPANPSYSSEGILYLWDATSTATVSATPKLFGVSASSIGAANGW
jgi:hypothetical protein